MKKTILLIATIFLTGLSVSAGSKKVIIPLTTEVVIEDTYTIIWNGSSLAYRWVNDNWERAANYDYQFSVLQKRYNNLWKSVKTLHRMHPDYDGRAGDRDQTMYFELAFSLSHDSIVSNLNSSLGEGKGFTDKEFREQTIEFKVDGLSSFVPYDHMRITQHYNYEDGLLTETVFLFKLKDGKEIPFMKNEEKAYFYIKGKLDKAPTVFKR